MSLMDTLGLVVHDEQTFLSRVINEGTEQGIFTRDRADEIIRISVAMANKYVLQKEVDFRSTEDLANVQETIIKLMSVGLEMKSKGKLEEGVQALMTTSPVELFRLAYTRIEKLRHRWRLLLLNHRLEILVSREEYESLSGLARGRLTEMSIFNESELHTIESLKLEDSLFSSLSLVEYYEAELERYQFILRLKDILPFDLIHKSRKVSAELLSEVDSLREAFVNTLIVSAYVDSPDTVTASMDDVREFLSGLDLEGGLDVIPDHLEEVLLDIIQELGEGLDEREAQLLTREIIEIAQKLLDTIMHEREAVTSPSEAVFFKRWSRMLILSGGPDPIQRILLGEDFLDEFEFELLVERILTLPEGEAKQIIGQIPWRRMNPNQIIRLFQQSEAYQPLMAKRVPLTGFTALELVDLLEGTEAAIVKAMLPSLEKALADAEFALEDLELLAGLPDDEALQILNLAKPPADLDLSQILLEFKDGSERTRKVLFWACKGREPFDELLDEAWAVDPEFVKRQVKLLPAAQVGPFFASAAKNRKPKVVTEKGQEAGLDFRSKMLNELFGALPKTKKKAAVKFFQKS
jgi:hypothetical protein